MKILLYGINFTPELTGIGKFTGDMASWLATQGHQVKVVTAPPYYPAWAIGSNYSGSAWIKEHWRGATVYRCPLWIPHRPGGLKRLLYLASFTLTSLPVMLRQVLWRPDVVWVVEPALFCAPAAAAVARLSGAKSWLHVQDFEVDAAFSLGLLHGETLRRMVVTAERWMMQRFDVVSTISHSMMKRAASKGVDSSHLRYFPNWVDISQVAPPPSDSVSTYRRELRISSDSVVALYSGNMGDKQGLEVLAQVARLCHSLTAPKIIFVFCGDGVGRANLVALCEGLSNVRFIPLQAPERLAELLSSANIHLLPQRSDAADLVMPSKLTGMLASARPVVATAHEGTELATVVQLCGLVVPPEDFMAMTTAVLTLANDVALRERLGIAGQLYAQEHMLKEKVLKQFEADLLELAGKSASHGDQPIDPAQ